MQNLFSHQIIKLKGLYYALLQSLLFWVCTRTCSHAWWFEKLIIFHIIHNLHYYNTFLPSLAQRARLVPGLMKGRLPKNEMCCDWLAVPRRRFSTAPPLPKLLVPSAPV